MTREVRWPALPRLVSEGGEFSIDVPRSDEEAEVLALFAAAARRFLVAVEGALREWEDVEVLVIGQGAQDRVDADTRIINRSQQIRPRRGRGRNSDD